MGLVLDRIPLPEPAWFAVMTEPRAEGIAATWLRRAGYWATYPLDRIQTRQRRPHGRTLVQWVEKPRFSRYIFVALRYINEPIGPINSAKGVSKLVTRPLSGIPLQIPCAVIDAILDERLFELDDDRGALVMSETHLPQLNGDTDLRVLMGQLGKWKCERVAA